MSDTLTLKDLISLSHEMQEPFLRPPSLFGLRLREISEYPALKIRDDFEWCTEAFRCSMNAWLLEQFGTISMVPKGQAFVTATEIILRREDAALLRKVYGA